MALRQLSEWPMEMDTQATKVSCPASRRMHQFRAANTPEYIGLW
jgi:hypothetical protein